MQVAKVLIDGPRELIFDYAIPAELAGAVHAGSRVRIPLGPRRATGTVTEVVAEPNPGSPAAEFTVKPLLGLIGGQAAVPPALLRLARWLADYYMAPLEQVMRSLLPVSVRAEKTGFRTRKILRLPDVFTPEQQSLMASLPSKRCENEPLHWNSAVSNTPCSSGVSMRTTGAASDLRARSATVFRTVSSKP